MNMLQIIKRIDELNSELERKMKEQGTLVRISKKPQVVLKREKINRPQKYAYQRDTQKLLFIKAIPIVFVKDAE